MSAHDKSHLAEDWYRSQTEIPKKVHKTRYVKRHELEHDTTNTPNLSDADMYLNMTIHNYFEDRTIPCNYTENRKKPLLWNGKDWKMSVVRFDCPSQEIPMFFWKGDTNFQLGVYTVRDDAVIEQSGFQNVEYVSREDPVPADGEKAIWTVDQMVEAINSAVDVACDALPVANPLRATPANRPRLIYIPESQLFQWIYPETIAGAAPYTGLTWTDGLGGTAYIYVNQKLDFLFDNFPKLESKTGSRVDSVRYLVYDNPNNLVDIGGSNYYVMEQQHSTLNLWYELYKIVITSNMEIRKEYIGIATDNEAGGNPDSLSARGILTDFDLAFPRATSLRINYAPTAEYRWIDVLKEGILDFLDFKIYYQTQDGRLRELLLEPDQSANIKVLFRKK